MARPTLPRHQLLALLALTFATGVVDAISFLGLDRVFTGNMTGNVVVLGMALAGAPGLSIVGSLTALVGFLVGTAVGGRALRGTPDGWNRTVTALLAADAALLAAVGLALALLDPAGTVAVSGVTAVLGTAMGAQAAAARHVAVPDVSTVAVTNTLIGLGFDSPLGAGRAGRRTLQAVVVVLILVGALVGALLLRWHPAAGIGLATVVVTAAATLGGRARTPR